MTAKPHVAVVGAGAFGGWTALYLLRRGAKVTLIDAWGPGNSRASSAGETRILRGTYGPNQPYTRMAARAKQLWMEHEKRWGLRLLHRTGVLWMVTKADDQYERASLPLLREAGIAYEELSSAEMAKRWPQINFEAVRWAIYERDSGFLMAREACQAVVKAFIAEGGEYRQAAVAVASPEASYRNGLRLLDGSSVLGSSLAADKYVFACGPWLGKLFPETIGHRIRATKQEVLFFGTPAGDDRFSEAKLPVWADDGDRFMYGIPATAGSGFKLADDTRGPEFDPTSGERTVSAETIKLLREYLSFRFPAMKGAPLVETQVCQYENTADNHFVVDRHPAMENVWIVGGGSGHGFKHGPALGEMVAECVMEGREPDRFFRLARFAG
jgi:monomeric sarcosine oxidase